MEFISFNEASLLDVRASRGIVKDYSLPTTSAQSHTPVSDYSILMDMARNDPILFTAIDLTRDLVTFNGFDFTGDDSKRQKAKDFFLNDLDFDEVMDNVLFQLLVYGDAFLELRYDATGKLAELHPLETSQMEIKYDKHGEITGYIQKPTGTTDKKNWIEFTTDEVIYFRAYWIGSQVYSYSPFKPIVRSYNARVFGNHYVSEIFRTLPPEVIYFLKQANKEQRELFVQNLIRAKTNVGSGLIMQGDGVDAKLLQIAFDSGLVNVLEYLRKEVLTITRVPPFWVGITDGSNRSTAEAEMIPFETKIRKLQNKIVSKVNKELMPKTEFKDLKFKYNPISLMDEKLIMENAMQMKGIGLTSDDEKNHPIISYLKEHGVNLPEDAKILDETAIPKDAFPSRFGDNPKGNKMTSNVNKKGVSEDGKEKRQEMSMRGTLLSGYPYNYEVVNE